MLEKSDKAHYLGGIVVFRNRLTAIAGRQSKLVEVYETDHWNRTIIPRVGNSVGKLYQFSNLVTDDSIFVFGTLFYFF